MINLSSVFVVSKIIENFREKSSEETIDRHKQMTCSVLVLLVLLGLLRQVLCIE